MTMWVDKYRPKNFSDLLGEDVSIVKDLLSSPDFVSESESTEKSWDG